MVEFFKNNFLDKAPDRNPKTKEDSRPDPRKKYEDPRSDRFEDWFENRIEKNENTVDFSQLPENPTDEEIVEFFRNNFMNKGNERNSDGKFDENFKNNDCPFHGHKPGPRHPYAPEKNQEPDAVPSEEPKETA
jgi:hypothetical protein